MLSSRLVRVAISNTGVVQVLGPNPRRKSITFFTPVGAGVENWGNTTQDGVTVDNAFTRRANVSFDELVLTTEVHGEIVTQPWLVSAGNSAVTVLEAFE